MKKKILVTICIAMMLTLAPQAVFASDNDAHTNATSQDIVAFVNGNIIPSAVEPRSRWYSEIVIVKENEPFTEYNEGKTRRAVGVYTQKVLYFVYRDGSGKRVHQHDTYYYTWTGYKKVGKDWVKMSDYINVQDTIIDRGPVRELFSILI